MKKDKKICICVSDKKAYSETFIKAHIDNLNAFVISKSMLPSEDAGLFANSSESTVVTRFKNFVSKRYAFIEDQKKSKILKEKFEQENVGVVLAEYGQIGVAILNTCKKNNVPLVVHFHGFDAYKKDALKKFEKKYLELFDYASAVIAVSHDMERQLISIGAEKTKVFYNVYGVDIEKFKKCDVLNSKKQFLFAGRFVEKKAPHLAILAFKKALEGVPDAKFIMVGDGMLWEDCKKMVESFGLNDSIVLPGAKNHSEIADLMLVSRAYVQHSVIPESGDSEGTPNSILEAQACGVPVISTKHGGINDVVLHGETGFLVNEGDVDGMAKYMVELLNDNKLAFSMGEKARKNAIQNFTLKDSIAKLNAILESKMR